MIIKALFDDLHTRVSARDCLSSSDSLIREIQEISKDSFVYADFLDDDVSVRKFFMPHIFRAQVSWVLRVGESVEVCDLDSLWSSVYLNDDLNDTKSNLNFIFDELRGLAHQNIRTVLYEDETELKFFILSSEKYRRDSIDVIPWSWL